MNAYTKGQNAAITYLNENPTTSKVAFLNASQAQAASLYKSQASITQFIRGFLSLESEYHFATVPASTEPVIVETLTADDGETVETGYIYQEEDDEEEVIQDVCGKCYIDEAAVSAITPLQSSLMGFFAAVGMWAVFQEVDAWDVTPADDTAWLHAFQAADEWIAENGHPEGCICGFCKEALQAAWDALQAVPAYVERDACAKGLYARLKAGETLQVAPVGNPDNPFSIRPDAWEGMILGYTILVDGEPVPGNVGMMLDSETIKEWLSELVERKREVLV